jgi:hypothetical protein
MSLALPFLRASRALGQQEDTVGYRHEFYQEDADRIHVDTDTFHFDTGASSHVRVTGEFVIDSISGATPTGAPPQSQWPFPTYNTFYQAAYTPAYNGLFNQFISDNLINVQFGYWTPQQLTNNATQYAQGGAPAVAAQNAGQAYTALTNNPNYHNTSVPLTYMHDHRDAFSLGVPVGFGQHLITPSFSYSEEHDYISFGGALNYALSLNNKNTTLSVGWSHNSDSVRDDKFVWEPKTTDDFFFGISQLLTRKSYVTANLTYGHETGYLADPYRGVMPETGFPQYNPSDAALIPEVRPRERDRGVAYFTFTQFVDPAHASIDLGYRFFRDSWDVTAHTAEIAWRQKIGRYVVLSPTFRYYHQSAANFYYVLVPDYNNLPEAYSSDYRLSKFESFAYGVELTCRVQRHLSVDASYLRYEMQGLDGVTSQSAYPSANVFTIGLRLWF